MVLVIVFGLNRSCHGCPHQKSWTSAPKSAFTCGAGDREKPFDPRASGRKGQECLREIRTEKFRCQWPYVFWYCTLSHCTTKSLITKARNGQIVGQPRKRERRQNARKTSKNVRKMSKNCPEEPKRQFGTFFGQFLPVWSILFLVTLSYVRPLQTKAMEFARLITDIK